MPLEKYSFHKKWKKWQKMDETELDPERPWSSTSSTPDKKGFNVREKPWQPPTRTNSGDSFARMPMDRAPTIPTVTGLPPASLRGAPTFPAPPTLRDMNSVPHARQYSGVSAVSVPIAFEGTVGRGGTYSVGTAR